MRARPSLGTPKGPSLLVLLLLATLTPRALDAQGPEGRVGAWAGPSLLISEVVDQGSALVGAEAGLILGSHVRLAGAGYSLLGTAELEQPGSTPLDLTLGYGGVVVHYLLGGTDRLVLGVGVLAGGGTARIRDPVVGVELGSDNFLVLEPRLSAHLSLHSSFQLSLSARFRSPWGVDDLSGVSNEDLRGLVAALSLSVGSFQ